MNYVNNNRPKKHRSIKKPLAIVLVIFILGVIGWWFFVRDTKTANTSTGNQVTESNQEVVAQKPVLPNLQPVVDEWVNNHPGTYAVKITDTDGNSLAETNGDQQFFAASIYKLPVAYIGYQKVGGGAYKPGEAYISGYTRAECLDAMIRDSYSPCAEKMWAELGKEKLTTTMKTYGLTNTSLVGLSTTANDSAKMAQLIYSGKDLSPASKATYLDSMKTQEAKYRRGLPSGIASGVVYNKVGWNLDQEWHDVAIVELSNGKTVIIAILTEGTGYKNVAGLATEIEKALQ